MPYLKLAWFHVWLSIFSDYDSCGILHVHFTFSREGRPSGEAFVEFMSDEDVERALKKHNKNMGSRYIEGISYAI